MVHRLFFILLLLLLLFTCCLPGIALAALQPEELQTALDKRVTSGANRCIAAALVTPRGVTFLSACSQQAPSSQAPSVETLFETGSVSKVFTGVLAAAASLRGEVALDATVSEVLPNERDLQNSPLARVTLLDLATHTSGLTRMPLNWKPKDPADPYGHYDEALLLDALAAPGEAVEQGRYVYSNFGAGLLGYLLGRVAGENYGELLRQRIAQPLGMRETVLQPGPELLPRLAAGHDSSGKPAPAWSTGVLAGCYAVDSTARDLALFLQANLGQISVPPQLADALRLARQPVRPGPVEQVRMGLGWHVLNLGEKELVFHDGGTGGHRAFLGFSPSDRTGVALLSDTSTDISDLGLHALEPRIPLNPPLTPISLSGSELEAYAGRYRLPPQPEAGVEETMLVQIEVQENGLGYRDVSGVIEKGEAVGSGGQDGQGEAVGSGESGESGETALLLPVDADLFVFESTRDAVVFFDRDATGRVTGLRIQAGGREIRGQRQ